MTISSQLTIQGISVLTTLIYSGVMSFVILKVIDMPGLRVDEEQESQGLICRCMMNAAMCCNPFDLS